MGEGGGSFDSELFLRSLLPRKFISPANTLPPPPLLLMFGNMPMLQSSLFFGLLFALLLLRRAIIAATLLPPKPLRMLHNPSPSAIWPAGM